MDFMRRVQPTLPQFSLDFLVFWISSLVRGLRGEFFDKDKELRGWAPSTLPLTLKRQGRILFYEFVGDRKALRGELRRWIVL